MTAETGVGAPVSLGSGRSICPPNGWIQKGYVTENVSRLDLKSKLEWNPPGVDSATLHWQLSNRALPEDVMDVLIKLVSEFPGPLPLEAVVPLYERLIRMPADSIQSAQTIYRPDFGNLLRVDYAFVGYPEVGIVHYCPTEMYEFGEFQILAYEGREPEYSRFLSIAEQAMATLKINAGQLPDNRGLYFRAPAESTVATVDGSFSDWLDEEEPDEDEDEGDEYEAVTGEEDNSVNTDRSFAALLDEEVPDDNEDQEATRKDVPAQTSEPAGESPAAYYSGEYATPELNMDEVERLSRSLDAVAEAQQDNRTEQRNYTEHVLQAGETISSLARSAWPHLDADAVKEKVKEIYNLNLQHGNRLEAWNLKPGTVILLPKQG
jgi:hypothetical protein